MDPKENIYNSDPESEQDNSRFVELETNSRMNQSSHISSGTSWTLPMCSKLVDMCRPVLSPGVMLVEQSLVPLGYNFLEAVDEKIITKVSDKTIQMKDKTRQTMLSIVHTSDQLACQCYNTIVPKFYSDTNEKSGKSQLLLDKVLGYFASFMVVQLAIEVMNFFIATMLVFTLLGMFSVFISMALMVAPMSFVGLVGLTSLTVMIMLCCVTTVSAMLSLPLILIGSLSSIFFILLY